MSKCKENCKCASCACNKPTGKDSDKDLLIGRLKEAIKELIMQSIEETSATGGISGFSTPYAFGNRGKKIATAGLPGFEKVSDVDETKKKNAPKAAPKAAPKVVPVGKEKGPNIVINPENPNKIDSSDKVVIAKREKVAATKGDKEGVKLYKKLKNLANRQGVK